MSSFEREDGEFSSEYVQFEVLLKHVSSRKFGQHSWEIQKWLSPTFSQS